MMGRQVEQAALFYEFSLETHVPADHRLRSIDRFVELGEVRRELTSFYSTLGRPSIDPELMIRMLIIGYCFGIRSERRLCEEVHPQSGIQMVLQARARRRYPGSFHLLEEPAWPIPRERSATTRLCDGPAALHRRGTGRRRSLCDRCQSDQGGCQSAERDRG
jgi:hypothetical protein